MLYHDIFNKFNVSFSNFFRLCNFIGSNDFARMIKYRGLRDKYIRDIIITCKIQ